MDKLSVFLKTSVIRQLYFSKEKSRVLNMTFIKLLIIETPWPHLKNSFKLLHAF